MAGSQAGGLNFKKHYANAPVCCPSRATFWSGRHASNIPHVHPGYPNITVGGAWYEPAREKPSRAAPRVPVRKKGHRVPVGGLLG